MPELLSYLWEYFQQLSNERPVNGFSVQGITSTGIVDWCTLHCVTLEAWEVKAIKMLDAVYIASADTKETNDD